MNSTPPREFVGVVTELDISGWGPNSAQLEFSLTPQSGQPVTFVMEFDAVPQMFAAGATMLTMAFEKKMPIRAIFPANQTGTPRISGLKLPA